MLLFSSSDDLMKRVSHLTAPLASPRLSLLLKRQKP